MLIPPTPHDEKERLETLRGMKLLDTPIEECFERITRLSKSIFDVPIVTITLVDEQRQWFKSIQGLNECETTRDVSFCAHAILHDDIFVVFDALSDERFRDNPLVTGKPHIRFYAGCPISACNGKKVGTICILDHTPRGFSEAESLHLKDLAVLTEISMKNRRISHAQEGLMNDLDQARLAALIDPLTRLWNREGISQIINFQLKKKDALSHPFGLAILDIDHFKNVNDTYGHSCGDAALRAVTKYLLTSCREDDAIGRWGGEEFIILFNAQDPDTIHSIAQRLCAKISQIPIHLDDNQSINVSATIGLTMVHPESNFDLEHYIKIADEALYLGKKKGRNQVIMK